MHFQMPGIRSHSKFILRHLEVISGEFICREGTKRKRGRRAKEKLKHKIYRFTDMKILFVNNGFAHEDDSDGPER